MSNIQFNEKKKNEKKNNNKKEREKNNNNNNIMVKCAWGTRAWLCEYLVIKKRKKVAYS